MTLTDICVSFELAKQLKEAGYPQKEVIFTYVQDTHTQEYKLTTFQDPFYGAVSNYHAAGFDDLNHPMYAAPTAAEIGEKFPYANIGANNLCVELRKGIASWRVYWMNISASDGELLYDTDEQKMVDAMAKMWLYLKEEGLL